MYVKTLDDTVEEMKNMARMLVPHTSPMSYLCDDDPDFVWMKEREITIDGYFIKLHFSRSDYETSYIEKLEILPIHALRLPMYICCKLAVKFLGAYGLCLTEVMNSNQKIYVWRLELDKRGRPIETFAPNTQYEQFQYARM